MNFRPSGQTQQSPVSVRLPLPNIRPINRPIGNNMTNQQLAPRPQVYNQYYLLPKGGINPVQATTTYPNMVQMRALSVPQSLNQTNGSVPVIQRPQVVNQTSTVATGSGKLLLFFKQLLDLSQKSKRTDAHAGVVTLVQKLVNREVNSQTFCTQLQAILKSDNTKTNIGPFIEDNIDSLRRDLYNGKFSLPDVRPPDKSMVDDILTTTASNNQPGQMKITPASSITSISSASSMTNASPISIQTLNNRHPTVIQNQRFTTSTVTSAPTLMTSGSIMTSGVPIARFATNNSTLIQPQPSIAPISQRPIIQSGIISANNSAKMLLTNNPQNTNRLLAPNSNVRSIVQNQPASANTANITSVRSPMVAPKPAANNGMSITNYYGAKMITVPQSNDNHGNSSISTNDQPFFPTNVVKTKMEEITSASSNSSIVVSEDSAACLAHALHSFTKSLLIRLNIVVQHRTDRLVDDVRLKQVDAVRDQIGFLQRLDEHQMNRQSDLEKELILKAAKSRSKFEDPDQIKVREMAKRLANEDYEREKQHQANMTALSAIQGFKKRRLDTANPVATGVDSNQTSSTEPTDPSSSNTPASASALLAVKRNSGNLGSTSLSNRLSISSVKSLAKNEASDTFQNNSQIQNIRSFASSAALRTKKACLKDLQFVLSKHSTLSKSRTLYKSYWRS